MQITFLNTLYPPYGSAGAETTLRLLARSLQGRGHSCSVVTLTPEKEASTGEIDGIPVYYLPLANFYWPHGDSRPLAIRPFFQAAEAYNPIMRRRLARALAKLRPDVVNAHNLQGFSAAAWSASRQLRIPLVQTLHDYYAVCPRSTMWRPQPGNCATLCTECRVFGAPRRALSRLPEAVTCVSHRVFDRLTAAGGFPEAKGGNQPVRIIRGNNAADALPTMQPPTGQPGLRLGFIGRLDPSKGVENLLDAVRRLPPGIASLRIAGTGHPDYVAALRDRATGVPGVVFVGHVAPAGFFTEIDLLVVPSVWEDPFPRVFHEALAYGVPSLVTALGGLPEVINDGRDGFVLREMSADALFERLSDLAARSWDRAAVFAACRKAAANYAPSHVAGQYEAVMQAVVDRRPVPRDAGEPWRGQAVDAPSVPPGRTAAKEIVS